MSGSLAKNPNNISAADDEEDDKPVLHDYSLNPQDPNYVQGSAQRQQAYGSGAAAALQNIGQGAVTQGEQMGGTLYQQGQQAQSYLTTGALQAQQALDQNARMGQQGIVQAGLGAAQGITGATQAGQQQIAGATQQSAGALTGAAQSAAAAQAAAQGRTFNPLDYAAADQSLIGAGALGGQLAGLEAVEGPSAAQAQLQSGLNAAQQSNLALARSGRGWGGSASALSQAAVQNAQAGQQAANAAAALRAQENAQWRARQAANLGAAGQLGLGIAGQQAGMAQAQGQLGLQQQALADQTALGYGAQNLGALEAASGTQMQGALAGAGMGLEGAQAAGAANLQGMTAGYGFGQQGIGEAYAQGLAGLEAGFGMGLQGTQAGADTLLQGYGLGAGMYGQAGQMGIAGEQAANQLYLAEANQYRGAVQDDLTRYGIQSGVAVNNAGMQNQVIGGAVSAGAAMLPLLLAASDRDAKMDIKPASTIEIPPIGTSGPSSARPTPVGGAAMGPGGPAYDQAMASAARADKKYGPREDTMIELNKPSGFASGLAAGAQSFGNAMMAGSRTNPYQWNPYAQQYLASDERSKTRIAELEGQVDAYREQLGFKPGAMELGYDTGSKIYRPIGSRVGEAPPTADPMGAERMARLGLDVEGNPLSSGFAPGLYDSLPSDADVARRVVRGGDRVVGAPDVFDPYSNVDVAALDEAYRRQGGEPVMPKPSAAAEAIDKAPPFEYEYRDPDRFGYGRKIGPMANDLEKTPAGADVVTRGPGPENYRMIDVPKLSLLNTAALHQVQERLDNLESGKKPKESSAPSIGYNPFQFAAPAYDQAALDEAYLRSAAAPAYGYPGAF